VLIRTADLTFLIAHLSDPHIGPLPKIPLGKLLNKRLTGAMNWHSARATIHNMDVLNEIMADIAAQGPDHVALTGDLVNVGYGPEFPQALAMTKALGTPDRVSIIPGNHDAYTRESLPAMEEIFRPFMLGDAEAGSAGPATFPYFRRRDDVALIGVNSGVPTLPFMATGTVGREQRAALAALLEDAGSQGLFRVVMIHHPPLKAASRFARGLTDSTAFMDILAKHGAELVLHGHNHRYSQHVIPTKTGPVPIVGVASASAVPGTPHHQAEYNLIRIDPARRRFDLRRRGFQHGLPGIRDIGTATFSSTNP
jgi:3',5'-cyclic AMP phosphodiesterase CpdA